MILILFGPPGAGKGTQSEKLKAFHGFTHLSTGDMFRENMSKNTALGLEAKSYIDKGALVPDDLVDRMLFDAMARSGFSARLGNIKILLDGYPRNRTQVQALSKFVLDHPVSVIDMQVNEDILISRLAKRRICSNKACKAIFAEPTESEGTCPKCGSPGTIRPDDMPSAVRHRLHVFRTETSEVLQECREQKWSVASIDAMGEEASIADSIQEVLRRPRQ